MLVTMKEILELAERKGCAVGAFNTPNLECIAAVLNAAERLNEPVIISHAQIHDDASPLAVIGPVMVQAAKNAKAFLSVEMSMGQMVEDIKLATEGKAPVYFFGRTGGIIPTPEEIVEEVKKIAKEIK